MADSDNESSGKNNAGGEFASPREQDRFLPIANVSRIMKKALPANAKISKDAKETVQECVSEFISFITVEASDKCQREKRKTINGDDLLWAMATLSFEEYVEPLKVYLQRFREMEGEKAGPTTSSSSQSLQKEGIAGDVGMGNDGGGGGGFGTVAGAAGLYPGGAGGGGMIMMGQQLYGASLAAPQYHHQMNLGATGGKGSLGGGGGGSGNPPAGFGRQG